MKNYEELKNDWENVPVDMPILVRDTDYEYWKKQHFADFFNGRVHAWDHGATSFTNVYEKVLWNYAKLWEGSEEQEAEREVQCTEC